MKVECLTDYYTNVDRGITCRKGDVLDLKPEDAEYLLNTFPKWFKKVAETKEKNLSEKIETKKIPKSITFKKT